MKTYIVTYQFRNYSKNYTSFYEAIKTNYPEWQHPMESLWLIRTDETPLEIFTRLKSHLEDTDSIFVAEITDSHEGRMPSSFWPWIKDNSNRKMNTYSIPISTTVDIDIDFKTIYNIIIDEYDGQEITDDEIWYVFGDNILYYLNRSGIDISKFDDADPVFDEIWYDFDKWLKNKE